MNSKQFDRALEGISDDLIDAAAGAYEKKKNWKKSVTRVASAACAGLVLTAACVFWNGRTNTPDPTQPTISVENPTTAPAESTTLPENGQGGIRIMLLSSNNGEKTEIPLEIGIATPLEYVVFVRDLRGLDKEKCNKASQEWNEFKNNALEDRDDTGGILSTFVNEDVMVGTYIKGFLEITSNRSEIQAVFAYNVNEGVGDLAWGNNAGAYHVEWLIRPQLLMEDPGIPLSSVYDSIKVTVTYDDGMTETVVIDISLDDSGQVYATLAGAPETA